MKSIFIVGLIIAIVPFLGFPGSWETALFVILGLYVFGRAFYFYKYGMAEKKLEDKDSSYKQNDNLAKDLPDVDFRDEDDKNENVSTKEGFDEENNHDEDVDEDEGQNEDTNEDGEESKESKE